MHEYVNTDEWSDFVSGFMNEFLKDKEEYGKEKFSEGQQNGIQKMITSYRTNFNLDNTKIFSLLKESYGSSFTDDQLIAMLNNTK